MTEPPPLPLPRLPKREAESHKGDYGRALLVGGSRGMTGAIGLAGLAALRSGAGLVTLAVPDRCLEVVASFDPCYMTTPLPADAEGRIAAVAEGRIVELAEPATALGFGPGLGRSQELVELAGAIYRGVQKPIVFDADGLNALAANPTVLDKPAGPRILTPHPGEFARLVGRDETDRTARQRIAVEKAGQWGVVLVLKGHRTLVTDGERTVNNTTGNPGMATGGTGDVLTGIITALLCQGLEPFDAARLGVYLHGEAGDLAAVTLGQVSLVARDLVDLLPAAFAGLES